MPMTTLDGDKQVDINLLRGVLFELKKIRKIRAHKFQFIGGKAK